MAPFAPGRTSLVLLVFGGATVAGIWITGIVADSHLRPALLTSLTLIAVAMLILGVAARATAALLAAAALWGMAFGGAPTLLQTALVDASGPARADVATALQTTVYNVGIAAGSLAGGLVLGGAGAAALPWVTLAFTAAALGTAATGRAAAPFPATDGRNGEYPRGRRCCRGRDGTAARRRAVLVRSAVPLGLDHFPLDAGGGEGPARAHRMADHVAGLPEPGPARGQGPDRGIPGTDEQGVGPDPGRRGRRPAARPRILGPLYTAIGTRYHVQGRREDPRRSPRPWPRWGCPADLASAAESTELDQLIKDSHNEAFDDVGLDVGTPVIRIRGNAIFGPVVTPAPRGEAAGRLWDGVALVTGTDGFFELKRSRDRKPSFD